MATETELKAALFDFVSRVNMERADQELTVSEDMLFAAIKELSRLRAQAERMQLVLEAMASARPAIEEFAAERFEDTCIFCGATANLDTWWNDEKRKPIMHDAGCPVTLARQILESQNAAPK